MKRIFLFALVACLLVPAVSEAGLFRKRNGERRAPVRNVFRGGCAGGQCGR